MSPDSQKVLGEMVAHVLRKEALTRAESAEAKLAQCEEKLAECLVTRSRIQHSLNAANNEVLAYKTECSTRTAAHAKAVEDAKRITAGIMEALMHLDTNYCIDGHSMKDSDAATALRRVLRAIAPAGSGKEGATV